MEIWHNPRCSKSRAAKKALDDAGIDYTERRYLDEPPTAGELSDVLDKLGLEPWDITRMAEARAKELGLATLAKERQRWIDVLTENPVLIQRPIVVTDDGRAVVARDEQSVADVVDK